MGAIFAIIGDDSEETLRHRLQPMLDRSSYRGEPQILQVPGVVLAIQTLGWDASMAQNKEHVVCFHGFIGNWDELKAAHKDIMGDEESEAGRVARAYNILGDKLFAQLRGEFSTLIYHRADRSLKAVRDVIGARPLYYRLFQGSTYLATEIRQVQAGSGARRELNNNACAARLLNSYYLATDTLFEGVSRVAPAKIYRFQSGGTNPLSIPYWELSKAPPRNAPTDYRELAEEALHHIERALRRYIPHEPYAFSLSGGLDSGAMWSILGDWSKKGDLTQQRGHAYSMILPGMVCNEEDIIRQYETLYPGNYHYLDASALRPGMYHTKMLETLDHVPTSSFYTLFWFAERIQADYPHRHEISGNGGDELFGGTLNYLADELMAGRFMTVIQDFLTLRMPISISRYSIFRNSLIKPCVHRLRLHPGPWRTPAWLGPSYRHVHHAIEARSSTVGYPSWSQQGLANILHHHQTGTVLEPREQCLALYGLAPRNPLLDRDLIEFAHDLPPRAHWQGYRYKTLLRNAIRHLAPQDLTQRTAKTFYNEPYERERAEKSSQLRAPNTWLLAEKGILNPSSMKAYLAPLDPSKPLRNVDFLFRLLQLEFLCRSLESAG